MSETYLASMVIPWVDTKKGYRSRTVSALLKSLSTGEDVGEEEATRNEAQDQADYVGGRVVEVDANEEDTTP